MKEKRQVDRGILLPVTTTQLTTAKHPSIQQFALTLIRIDQNSTDVLHIKSVV